MADKIKIPSDLSGVKKRLGGLHKLLTATEWERGMIVHAFTTTDDKGGRPAESAAQGARNRSGFRPVPVRMTITAFSKEGIVGLRNKETVIRYRRAVQELVDAGVIEAPEPGGSYELPDPDEHPFPSTEDAGRGLGDDRRKALMEAGQAEGMRSGSKVANVAANTRAMAIAIQNDPETAKVAVEALLATPATARQITSSPAVRRAVAEDDHANLAVRKERRDHMRERLGNRDVSLPVPSPEEQADQVRRKALMEGVARTQEMYDASITISGGIRRLIELWNMIAQDSTPKEVHGGEELIEGLNIKIALLTTLMQAVEKGVIVPDLTRVGDEAIDELEAFANGGRSE